MKKVINKLLVIIFMFLICTCGVKAETKWNYIKSPKYIEELKDEYNKIPLKARDIYENSDLEIKIYGYNYYPNYIGLYNGEVNIESFKQNWLKNYYKRKGVKKNYSVKKLSINYAKMALIHELGHAYDYRNGLLSKQSEFIKIYKSEKKKFVKTSYYVYPMAKVKENIFNSMEYFATSFATYINSPKDLKKHCPKTYEYFENELTY